MNKVLHRDSLPYYAWVSIATLGGKCVTNPHKQRIIMPFHQHEKRELAACKPMAGHLPSPIVHLWLGRNIRGSFSPVLVQACLAWISSNSAWGNDHFLMSLTSTTLRSKKTTLHARPHMAQFLKMSECFLLWVYTQEQQEGSTLI